MANLLLSPKQNINMIKIRLKQKDSSNIFFQTKMKYLIIFFLMIAIHHSLIAQETRLNSFIQSYARKNNFDGTILVQQDTAIIYHEGFGIADRRSRKTRIK